jgi:flagellar biosynthesis/type III secretory pathway protein FliH
LKEINFVPDSSIERGGVRIDTDFGSVDARVDSQIEEIRERFRSQLHGRE